MCLKEKSTSEKLDMLYRKSLYLVALNLASTQNLDPSSVADIRRQYGDHLYSKGDYDGAMNQYVQTIGHLQPSYVVRKVKIVQMLFLRRLLTTPLRTVPRCAKNPQSRYLPTRVTFTRPC